MFLSTKRALWSAIFAGLVVIYSFNFVARYAEVFATRTLGRKILDYGLNFLIFFVGIYLLLTLATFIIKRGTK